MQQLHPATNKNGSAGGCAKGLLAVVPSVMRFIRHQMRRHRQMELSVPQFRTLVFLNCSRETTLSAMADHLGLSRPAASRLVDLLVKRGLIDRHIPPDDRRKVSLSLTGRGKEIFHSALAATEVAMVGQLRELPARDLARIGESMKILARVFAPENCRLSEEK